jgi:hypothetical protein
MILDKTKSRIKWLSGILSIACLLVGWIPTAFAQLNTFPPGTLPAGTLFPIAISKEFADQKNIFNNPQNTVRIYPTGTPDLAGAFITFTEPASSYNLRYQIQYGNPDPISIGDFIYFLGGTIGSAYNLIPTDEDVVLPVVDIIFNSNPNGPWPVYSFIGFHIFKTGPPVNVIYGYFLDTILVQGASGLGPDYGVRSTGYAGDLDGDGDVDGSDLVDLISNPALLDITIFAQNFGANALP